MFKDKEELLKLSSYSNCPLEILYNEMGSLFLKLLSAVQCVGSRAYCCCIVQGS